MNPGVHRLKWAVYAILLVDFLGFLYQDVEYARYTLDAGSDLFEVLAAYVTSIDLVAWFTLILLFELETGVLAGREWTGLVRWAVRSVRLVCYVAILHTSFSYDIALREFRNRNACRLRATFAPTSATGHSCATAITSRLTPAIARHSAADRSSSR